MHPTIASFQIKTICPPADSGNLIALPLAHRTRERGNSVFIDDDLQPYADQWTFLESLPQMTAAALSTLVQEATAAGRIFPGVRMPVDDDETEAPWLLPPSRRREAGAVRGKLPPSVNLVLADGIYVDQLSSRPISWRVLSAWPPFRIPSSTERKRCAYRHMESHESFRVLNCIRAT